jgi:2-methylisocitrate lyase-like PEP mutase family enzyme
VLGYGGTMEDVVARGKRYLEAGARCVFVWGVGKYEIKEEEVRGLVKELDGKVSIQPGVIGMAAAKKTGVARISTGPMLWRKGLEVMKDEAVKLMEA